MTYKKCKKACEKKGLRLPCITSKAVDEAQSAAIRLERDYSGWIAYNDKEEKKASLPGSDWLYVGAHARSRTRVRPKNPTTTPTLAARTARSSGAAATAGSHVPCDFTLPCYCQAVKGGGAPSAVISPGSHWQQKISTTTARLLPEGVEFGRHARLHFPSSNPGASKAANVQDLAP